MTRDRSAMDFTNIHNANSIFFLRLDDKNRGSYYEVSGFFIIWSGYP